jgi:hypothetical protein
MKNEIVVGKPGGMRPLGRLKNGRENIKMDLKEIQ